MNIRFEKINLHNFFSFIDAEVDLNDMGQVLVSGQNENPIDNATSNGSGKSTIFNGICWALTGKTIQGLSSNIENIYGNSNDCWVSLSFYVDSDRFFIKRVKTPKADLKVFINGEDCSGKGIQESSDVLTRYIPDLTSQLIGSIIILGQGLPYRFTDNKPSHRKELLENLTKSDFMIASIKEKLDDRYNELSVKLRGNEDNLIRNSTEYKLYTKQLEDSSKEMQECENYNSEYSLDSRIEYLDEKYKRLTNEHEELRTKISEYTAEIIKLNDQENSLSRDNVKVRDGALGNITELINESYKNITEKKSEIKMLDNEIIRLKKITGICPTCGQKLPDVNVVDTSEKEVKLNDLRDDLKQAELSYDILNKKKDSIIEEENRKFKDSIRYIDDEISRLRSELSDDNNSITELSNRINRCVSEQAKAQSMKLKYNELAGKIDELKNKITTLESARDVINHKIGDLKAHLDVVQEMIKYAKREFRGVLLQNVILYINKKVKQYSMEVFGTELLDFSLDGNNINITYCNKPYENLSGGEKQKVDIIVQLALRELLSNQVGIHSNILVVDEVFDSLDARGCQKILSLINGLNDIESMFIITHHKETLQITYDTELVVKKDQNGVSSLSFV